MHDDIRHFNLTFPSLATSEKETPPDLKRLLYKGGASIRVNQAANAIQNGLLGDVQLDRVELVSNIHEMINSSLVGGGSPETARGQIRGIASFFNWADKFGATVNLSAIEKTYLEWSEHLWQLAMVTKDIKKSTAYQMAVKIGQILDEVLERVTPISQMTRLKKVKRRKTPQGAKADKQNLANTFAFGHLMQDICDSLPLKVIRESEVIRIHLQQGGEITYARINGGRKPSIGKERNIYDVQKSMRISLDYANDLSLNHQFRQDMTNLRIYAELLMFIGQTGMNLAQAHNIHVMNFSYSSDIDGYKVKEYKNRRGGEVLFNIFSEYRDQFERYLAWRRELFPDEKRMFPLIRKGARKDSAPQFRPIKGACKKAGVPFVTPSMLRGTRVNWLLRRSRDAEMTSEMSGHSKKMLLTVYEIPSQQVAFSEIIQFHRRNDPILADQDPYLAVAPGQCDGIPVVSPRKPETATGPDCQRPSGCLWCEHHRDIDSLDYVWSIASFRHLKIIELSLQPPSKNSNVTHPAEHAINKLSEKLTWFRESNATRCEWAEEALARVEEGSYSDQWSHFIEAM